MNYQQILLDIYKESNLQPKIGKVASYIPELSEINPDKLGISLTTINGENFGIGDAEERFSIQSVSKALSLTLAISLLGEKFGKE